MSARSQKARQGVNALEGDCEEADIAALCTSESPSAGKFPKDTIKVTPTVKGQKLTMELDTGSAVSIALVSTFNEIFPDIELLPTSMQLRTYSGDRLHTLGKAKVECNGRAHDDLYLVDTTAPTTVR